MQKQRLLVAAVIATLMLPVVAWSEPPNRAEKEAARQAAFAQADANHDGTLSAGEFATFHQLMRQNFADRKFQRADANGDGGVTLDELAAARSHGRHGCK
jgi:Ca2+-binding EF-hand superfamily protein